MDATFWICVLDATPDLGETVKNTPPSPPGGKKPDVGSAGARPVDGSSDLNVHVSSPVETFAWALIATRMFRSGRKSTVVAKCRENDGGDTSRPPKVIEPSCTE